MEESVKVIEKMTKGERGAEDKGKTLNKKAPFSVVHRSTVDLETVPVAKIHTSPL